MSCRSHLPESNQRHRPHTAGHARTYGYIRQPLRCAAPVYAEPRRVAYELRQRCFATHALSCHVRAYYGAGVNAAFVTEAWCVRTPVPRVSRVRRLLFAKAVCMAAWLHSGVVYVAVLSHTQRHAHTCQNRSHPHKQYNEPFANNSNASLQMLVSSTGCLQESRQGLRNRHAHKTPLKHKPQHGVI